MSQAGETFFTIVGCMDGRVQGVIADFGRQKFNAEYPDTITEAGLVGLLSEHAEKDLIDNIKFKILDVSLLKHHSKGIVVHGHQGCAGNPANDKRHKNDVIKTAGLIRSLIPQDVLVVSVFVKRNRGGNNWIVEEI